MLTLGRFSTFSAHRGLRNVHNERDADDAANIAERSYLPKSQIDSASRRNKLNHVLLDPHLVNERVAVPVEA